MDCLGAEGLELCGVELERLSRLGDPPFEIGHAVGFEGIDKAELGQRSIGDVLDLVLTEHVQAEEARSNGHLGDGAVRGADDRLLARRARDDIGHAVLGPDGEVHPPAAEVSADEVLDPPPFDGIRRQRIEAEAGQFQHRGLASAACTDDRIEDGAEFEGLAIEEAADDGEADELVATHDVMVVHA